jgi:proline dehydrogenase
MLRRTFLYLSHQRSLRRWMETSSRAASLTKRFIAGKELSDGLAVCRRLHAEGIFATLDHLGENVTTLDEAEQSTANALKAIGELAALNADATFSIKLSQFGLDISKQDCFRNVERLVALASRLGSRVEVDMESSEYVDRTLEIVTGLHERYGSMRSVIQAYLFRSETDIRELSRRKIPVRLCKGAYKEPPEIAMASKRAVDESYCHLADMLLAGGTYPAFATHDKKMIESALDYVQQNSMRPEQFEFQMLYGIRRDLQKRLVEQGYRLRLYVPYGDAWYPYFMRRLAERPANVLFLVRNILRN